MKFYFAGGWNFTNQLREMKARNILTTWLDGGEDKLYTPDFDIFLDSAAFGAFTRGIDIKVEDYIAYIKKWQPKVYAALDVIGDEKGSKLNTMAMVKAGLEPIPCFHFGEPESYLRFYCEKFSYIALGGVAQLRTEARINSWMKGCFKIIHDYWPIKVHGFAVSRPYLLSQYPFYSADSTGWIGGKFGNWITYDAMKIKRDKVEFKPWRSVHGWQKILRQSIKSYLKLEDDVTRLWESRGIIWK
jgi:hypothetical protein